MESVENVCVYWWLNVDGLLKADLHQMIFMTIVIKFATTHAQCEDIFRRRVFCLTKSLRILPDGK